ncbi:MAG: hypothetical protein V1810_03175 [Candidatus Beckwithbacteria bacterium]
MNWQKKIYQQGQAVLIVLLVVAVALGFGLSIISQSITDVQITGHSEESVRAFNAAEAGIEEALTNLSGLLLIGGSSSMSVDNIEVDYSVEEASFVETIVRENDVAEVVLGGADTLTINWVESSNELENPEESCNGVSGGAPASLLISVIDVNGNVQRTAINACNLDAENGLTRVGVSDGEDGYLKKYSLAVGPNDERVRIRPLYNQATIRVTGTNLPVQTYIIDSSAQSPTLESKAIQVSRSVSAVPAIFDFVLFSGTNIMQ